VSASFGCLGTLVAGSLLMVGLAAYAALIVIAFACVCIVLGVRGLAARRRAAGR
jgi:hypothetical protein